MNELVVAALGKVNTLQGALENLRANRFGRALESLEQGLDVSVVMLKAIATRVDSAERGQVLEALRGIRDYRRAHPRRTEEDLSKFDQDVVAGILELQEKAREILDEVK